MLRRLLRAEIVSKLVHPRRVCGQYKRGTLELSGERCREHSSAVSEKSSSTSSMGTASMACAMLAPVVGASALGYLSWWSTCGDSRPPVRSGDATRNPTEVADCLRLGLMPPLEAQRTQVVRLPQFLSRDEVAALKAEIRMVNV
eukprot:SAG11_NODE_3107_length_2684_cov_2.457640_3_plen_144_part_00